MAIAQVTNEKSVRDRTKITKWDMFLAVWAWTWIFNQTVQTNFGIKFWVLCALVSGSNENDDDVDVVVVSNKPIDFRIGTSTVTICSCQKFSCFAFTICQENARRELRPGDQFFISETLTVFNFAESFHSLKLSFVRSWLNTQCAENCLFCASNITRIRSWLRDFVGRRS